MTGNYLTRDLHVGASDRECVRHVWLKLTRACRHDRALRAVRKDFYRDALKAHRRHQSLVAEFRL